MSALASELRKSESVIFTCNLDLSQNSIVLCCPPSPRVNTNALVRREMFRFVCQQSWSWVEFINVIEAGLPRNNRGSCGNMEPLHPFISALSIVSRRRIQEEHPIRCRDRFSWIFSTRCLDFWSSVKILFKTFAYTWSVFAMILLRSILVCGFVHSAKPGGHL